MTQLSSMFACVGLGYAGNALIIILLDHVIFFGKINTVIETVVTKCLSLYTMTRYTITRKESSNRQVGRQYWRKAEKGRQAAR